MKLEFALLSAFALCSGLASAQTTEQAAGHVRSLEDGAESPAATVDDLAWIAGSWEGTGFGGRIKETWSSPTSGTMLGMYRHDGEDGVSFYELELLVEEGDSLVWKVKHFSPDFTGWEEKDGFVTFPLVELTDDTAYFDGLTVHQNGPDELTIWLRVRSGDDVREEELRMTRSPLVATSN